MNSLEELKTVLDRPTLDIDALRSIQEFAFSDHNHLQRFREMVEALGRQAAQDDSPASKDAALRAGLCEWMLGRPARALEQLNRAKSTADRHFYAGLCQRELRSFAAAKSEFEKAAAQGWPAAACVCERAETAVVAGELDAAKTLIDGLDAGSKDSAVGCYVRGRLLEKQGDVEGAMAAYDRALELEPTHPRALFHMAFLSDLHGSDERALELYRRCATLAPVHANALINLSVVLEDRGETDEAETCLRRVLAANPNHHRAGLFLRDVMSSANEVIDEEWERQSEARNALLDTPISEYELSVRSRNCLKKLNINTLGDLARVSEADLLAYKNFGETSLSEIKVMLTQKGLRLGMALEAGSGSAPAAAARPAAVVRRPVPAGNPDLLNKPVSEMELSVRSRKCLQRLGIATVGDLAARSETELLAIRNFGQTSLNEIKRRLGEMGVNLAGGGK